MKGLSRSRLLALAVGLIVVAYLLTRSATTSAPAPTGAHRAILSVTGAGTALSISEGTAAGLEQHNGSPLPYHDSVVVHGGDVLTIGAQSSGTGKLTCEVVVDGAVVKSVTSEGQFATCTTAYVVP